MKEEEKSRYIDHQITLYFQYSFIQYIDDIFEEVIVGCNIINS
jgi:hypothetical protein